MNDSMLIAPGLPKQQKGAAAIEFALVFVMFFAVLYGLISYSLPMLMVQSFNAATAEGVPNLPANLRATTSMQL